MKEKPNNAVVIAEAIVWFAFVAFGGLASLQLLHFVKLTDIAQTIVGYAIGAFTVLVLAWLAFNAVKNK